MKPKEIAMPIKEIMTFTTGILIALFIANPLHFREAVHKLEFKILREATRTDNWGTEHLYLHDSKRD
jgi:hypothetical protein